MSTSLFRCPANAPRFSSALGLSCLSRQHQRDIESPGDALEAREERKKNERIGWRQRVRQRPISLSPPLLLLLHFSRFLRLSSSLSFSFPRSFSPLSFRNKTIADSPTMQPGNDDDGDKQQQEAKGPPTAPLPPPAFHQDERANADVSSSSLQHQQHQQQQQQQQQNTQYPRIAAVPNEHQHYTTTTTNWDPEAAAAAEFASQFAEAEARAGFVRRVLSIVSAQLVLTAAMTLMFFYSRGARSFLIANAWTVPASWVVGFAVSTTVREKFCFVFLVFSSASVLFCSVLFCSVLFCSLLPSSPSGK